MPQVGRAMLAIIGQNSDVRPPGRQGEVTTTTTLSLAEAGPKSLTIRYELRGAHNAPLLVVAGGISASRHVLANSADKTDGWWEVQAAAFAGFRVLAIDWIGADGILDLPICAEDQAAAVVAVLDRLDIGTAAAFVGASYGAMVGMHCVARAPSRFGGLLAISAAHRAHPFASAQRALQREAIEWGERTGDPDAGVALARKLAILTYRTPAEFADRFPQPSSFVDGRAQASAEPYLHHMGAKHCVRMSAVTYRRLSESIDCHQIDPQRITVPAAFVAVTSDQLVPADDIEAAAGAAPQGRFIRLTSRFGHDAFLKEDRAVADILFNFLSSLEPSQ